jgi:hypothetical protein
MRVDGAVGGAQHRRQRFGMRNRSAINAFEYLPRVLVNTKARHQ